MTVNTDITTHGRRDPLDLSTERFSALYERYAGPAYGLALRLTGDRSHADDAFQEAMVRVWRAAPRLRAGNLRAWVLRVVAWECLRLLKAEWRAEKLAAREKAMGVGEEVDDASGGLRSETLSALRDAMSRLPLRDNRMLKLCFEEGMTQRQIGKMLSVPQQTVSNRLQYSILRLHKELESFELADSR